MPSVRSVVAVIPMGPRVVDLFSFDWILVAMIYCCLVCGCSNHFKCLEFIIHTVIFVYSVTAFLAGVWLSIGSYSTLQVGCH